LASQKGWHDQTDDTSLRGTQNRMNRQKRLSAIWNKVNDSSKHRNSRNLNIIRSLHRQKLLLHKMHAMW